MAQQVFQQHPQRIGQLGCPLQAVLLGGGQAEIDVLLAADGEGLAALETVEALRHGSALLLGGMESGLVTFPPKRKAQRRRGGPKIRGWRLKFAQLARHDGFQ